MAFERISRIMETPGGDWVYAQHDPGTGRFRVICSGCPGLQDIPRRSHAGAVLAASYHAEHDPNETFVPTADEPPPPWRR